MTTLVFSANNDSYRSRQRTHRACDQCKRKRRKCLPPLESCEERCATCSKYESTCSLVQARRPDSPELVTSSTDLQRPQFSVFSSKRSPPQRRFIGDLNPESAFLNSERDIADCGNYYSSPSASPRSPTPRQIPAQIPHAYQAYLHSIEAFVLPPARTQAALIDIYLDSIHPLLPILDIPAFQAAYESNTVSRPLLLSVLLVGVKHPSASQYIPAGKNPRTWAQELYPKITALVNGGVEKDRLTLVRIHALLGLHSEGAAGNETASLHLSTAIHHAFSLGLQLRRRSLENSRSNAELWWSLWALDAFQAVLCGRPQGIRMEDLSVPFPGDTDPETFGALLRITNLLIEVITLYRPGGRREWEGPWPSFSSLSAVDAQEGSQVTDTLRLLYHAVSILSHRITASPIPVSSSSLARRENSSIAILDLCEKRKEKGWTPLPIIPYALSLALATFYSRLPQSQSQFTAACELLEHMSGNWWFAGAMARMGRQAVDRVQVREAAGALRDLGGGEEGGGGETARGGGRGLGEGARGSEERELDEMDLWWLQMFPDLAVPVEFWGEELGELDVEI